MSHTETATNSVKQRTIEPEIIDILKTADIDGNNVRLTCGQLDRKTYQRVNQVLEALGGKWDRKAKAHVFEDDPTDSLEQAVEFGAYVKPQDFGYFPTPMPLARELATLFSAPDLINILEPSCGHGNLVQAICDHAESKSAKILNLDLIELQPGLTEAVSTSVSNRVREVRAFEAQNFLSLTNQQKGELRQYTGIFMNPPFSKQKDISHVQHAIRHLEVGGLIVAIMSAGVTFRRDKKTTLFWEFVERELYWIDWWHLPEKSFRESGTDVRAIMLTGRKR